MKAPILVFAALPLLLGGCVGTNPTTPAATAISTNVTDAAEFTRMATSSNLLEIESSKLAMERSQDREVRRFAGQMIRDHNQAGKRMAAVVRRAGLPEAPMTLSARHQAMLDKLTAAGPEAFDAAYATLQAQAHEEAIALFSSYAQSGDNPRLVDFARKTLPTLQMHARHVERLTGGSGA
jgi:putative membrane protein